MIKFTAFLFLLSVSVAHASTPVEWALTPASSNELVRLLFAPDVDVADATCTVRVLRPEGQEPALESPDQALTCRWSAGARQQTFSLRGSTVDSWGQRSDPRSFELRGAAAEALFKRFQVKNLHLPFPSPAGSLWSRLYLCDTFGVNCNQGAVLSATADPDSAAQIACSRSSELLKKGDTRVDPAAFDNYVDYLDAMVEAQLAAGERVQRKLSCVFIAP